MSEQEESKQNTLSIKRPSLIKIPAMSERVDDLQIFSSSKNKSTRSLVKKLSCFDLKVTPSSKSRINFLQDN